MSRVARNPIAIPAGVEVTVAGKLVKVKGKKGALEYQVSECVELSKEEKLLRFKPTGQEENAEASAGTARALFRNMVYGVVEGYTRKLLLKGVGYKAQAQGAFLNLTVGFSHPIKYKMPAGVTCETPSQTEIILKSCDKQLLGQTAAEIRAFQPPEPYKGKGIQYDDEVVILKEGKKK